MLAIAVAALYGAFSGVFNSCAASRLAHGAAGAGVACRLLPPADYEQPADFPACIPGLFLHGVMAMSLKPSHTEHGRISRAPPYGQIGLDPHGLSSSSFAVGAACGQPPLGHLPFQLGLGPGKISTVAVLPQRSVQWQLVPTATPARTRAYGTTHGESVCIATPDNLGIITNCHDSWHPMGPLLPYGHF